MHKLVISWKDVYTTKNLLLIPPLLVHEFFWVFGHGHNTLMLPPLLCHDLPHNPSMRQCLILLYCIFRRANLLVDVQDYAHCFLHSPYQPSLLKAIAKLRTIDWFKLLTNYAISFSTEAPLCWHTIICIVMLATQLHAISWIEVT